MAQQLEEGEISSRVMHHHQPELRLRSFDEFGGKVTFSSVGEPAYFTVDRPRVNHNTAELSQRLIWSSPLPTTGTGDAHEVEAHLRRLAGELRNIISSLGYVQWIARSARDPSCITIQLRADGYMGRWLAKFKALGQVMAPFTRDQLASLPPANFCRFRFEMMHDKYHRLIGCIKTHCKASHDIAQYHALVDQSVRDDEDASRRRLERPAAANAVNSPSARSQLPQATSSSSTPGAFFQSPNNEMSASSGRRRGRSLSPERPRSPERQRSPSSHREHEGRSRSRSRPRDAQPPARENQVDPRAHAAAAGEVRHHGRPLELPPSGPMVEFCERSRGILSISGDVLSNAQIAPHATISSSNHQAVMQQLIWADPAGAPSEEALSNQQGREADLRQVATRLTAPGRANVGDLSKVARICYLDGTPSNLIHIQLRRTAPPTTMGSMLLRFNRDQTRSMMPYLEWQRTRHSEVRQSWMPSNSNVARVAEDQVRSRETVRPKSLERPTARRLEVTRRQDREPIQHEANAAAAAGMSSATPTTDPTPESSYAMLYLGACPRLSDARMVQGAIATINSDAIRQRVVWTDSAGAPAEADLATETDREMDLRQAGAQLIGSHLLNAPEVRWVTRLRNAAGGPSDRLLIQLASSTSVPSVLARFEDRSMVSYSDWIRGPVVPQAESIQPASSSSAIPSVVAAAAESMPSPADEAVYPMPPLETALGVSVSAASPADPEPTSVLSSVMDIEPTVTFPSYPCAPIHLYRPCYEYGSVTFDERMQADSIIKSASVFQFPSEVTNLTTGCQVHVPMGQKYLPQFREEAVTTGELGLQSRWADAAHSVDLMYQRGLLTPELGLRMAYRIAPAAANSVLLLHFDSPQAADVVRQRFKQTHQQQQQQQNGQPC